MGHGFIRIHNCKPGTRIDVVDVPLPLVSLDRFRREEGFNIENLRLSTAGVRALRGKAEDDQPILDYLAAMQRAPSVSLNAQLPRSRWLVDGKRFSSTES